MHRTLAARCLNRKLGGRVLPATAIPRYSYPITSRLYSTSLGATIRPLALANSPCQNRQAHTIASQNVLSNTEVPDSQDSGNSIRRLPVNCSGCGAFSQTSNPKGLGFFDLTSKRVRNWLHPKSRDREVSATDEDLVVSEALKSLDNGQLQALGLDRSSLVSEEAQPSTPAPSEKQPVCDRCHNLAHHGSSGAAAEVPMFHPTVDSLRETIEESPYKYNHIYHVIDAADFPMSLVPRLNVLLGDIPLRTRNRRSRSAKYIRDRKIELSFVITRGDLLGPTKENVDRNMPYLREVLREALGRVGYRVRLGNVSCVSAKRGWWTQNLREDIWSRGGANWMVGKVNVGKSQLFEAVYPKGRIVDESANKDAVVSMYPRDVPNAEEPSGETQDDDRYKNLDVAKLLPPAQPLKQYPEMPMVSSLPGTTASPIRIPFGNGKGELIDLPGLVRSDLELFVKPEQRQSLIMKSRLVPEQITVKPNNSLLLGGGLIRITPRTPGLTFLMYNFTPLQEHLTNNEKATEFQNQTRVSAGVDNITLPGVGDKMKHAGTFKLRYDVTRRRAGPLTRKNAVGLKVDQLPFRVLSLDLLIEGVGYVEVVAQMHAKALELPAKKPTSAPIKQEGSRALEELSDDPFAQMMAQRRGTDSIPPVASKSKPEPEPEPEEPAWPVIDVFTPEGRFVGSRQPIEGWLNNKPLVKAKHKRSRPRRSMKGQKKKEKGERRVTGAA